MDYLDRCGQVLDKFDIEKENHLIISSLELDKISTEEDFINHLNQSFYSLSSSNISIFFEMLNKSVIAGEYSSSTFIDRLEQIIKRIGNLVSGVDSMDIGLSIGSYYFEDIFIKCIIEPFSKALRHYKSLGLSFLDEISFDQNLYFLNIFRDDPLEDDLLKKWNYEFISFELEKFIEHNLKLATLDMNFIADPEALEELILIYGQYSEKNKSAIVDKILFNKCSFLIYKIYQRLNRDQRNYRYAIDFKDKEIKLDLIRSSIGYYKHFSDLTDLHYVEEIEGTSLVQDFESIESTLYDEPLCLHDFHGILKYYKDRERSVQNLKKIAKKFPSPDVNSNHVEFDKRASKISRHFADNNLFSLQLEKSTDPLKVIQSYIGSCQQYQEKHNVHNYFPYFKALTFLSKKIQSDMENYESNFYSIGKAIDLANPIIEHLYFAQEWSYDRDYIAYQALYNDCFFEVPIDETETLPVFLMSTCILPINYKQVEDDIKELVDRINSLTSIHEAKKMISPEILEVRSTSKRIDEVEKKNIEILSIFAAIVLFVTSNIQIFTKVDTLYDGLKFMLIMAYIMGLFILLIWLITRNPGFYKESDKSNSYRKLPFIHKCMIWFYGLSAFSFGLLAWGPIYTTSDKTKKQEIIELQDQYNKLIQSNESLTKDFQEIKEENRELRGKIKEVKDIKEKNNDQPIQPRKKTTG